MSLDVYNEYIKIVENNQKEHNKQWPVGTKVKALTETPFSPQRKGDIGYVVDGCITNPPSITVEFEIKGNLLIWAFEEKELLKI